MTDAEVFNITKILKSYEFGKEIQYSLKGKNDWQDCNLSEGINTVDYDYRVKPHMVPRYRAFKTSDDVDLIGKKVIYKGNKSGKALIVWQNGSSGYVSLGSKDDSYITFQNLFESWTFEDGSPCGMLVTEEDCDD